MNYTHFSEKELIKIVEVEDCDSLLYEMGVRMDGLLVELEENESTESDLQNYQEMLDESRDGINELEDELYEKNKLIASLADDLDKANREIVELKSKVNPML